MASFKLPKGTEQEIEVRKSTIQTAMKNAALVPLEVAKSASDMMDLVGKVIEKGNKNAVTDGAVAAMMARTAILSALYNVKINLDSVKDVEFVERVGKEVVQIEEKAYNIEKALLRKVKL